MNTDRMARTLDDFSDNELLTAPETAEVLRISRDLVYELIHRRELPAVHLGRRIRVPAFGLRQWIAAQAGVSAPTTNGSSAITGLQRH